MSTDPENTEPNVPMDSLLKAYAKQRREQAGETPGLHPATRRLLQAEVRRQYLPSGQRARVAAPSFAARLRWGWRALTFALGSVAVLVAVVWTSFRLADRGKESVQLARHDAQSPSETESRRLSGETAKAEPKLQVPVPAFAPASTSGSQPSPAASAVPSAPESLADTARRGNAGLAGQVTAEDRVTKGPTTPLARSRASEGASTPPAGPAIAFHLAEPSTSPPSGVGLQTRSYELNSVAPVVNGPASALAQTAEGVRRELEKERSQLADVQVQRRFVLARSEGYSNSPQRLFFRAASQQPFSRTPGTPATLAARDASPNGPVLSQFTLEQSGDQVRVIDADGSVYAGHFLAAPAAAAVANFSETVLRAEPMPADRPQEPAGALDAIANPHPSQTGAEVWNFRVQGTNRTLKEAVELEGILLSGAPGAAVAGPVPTSPERFSPAPLSTTAKPRARPEPASVAQSPVENAGAAAAFKAVTLVAPAAPGAGQSLLPTNLVSIQRLQGSLRIGATNRQRVDAFRSTP